MAGDWIKMRSNLRRHPKIVRIASALNADRLRVVGGLHAVWCLFDEHSDDGQLTGYTPSAVDEEIGWPGFSQALIAIGWVQWDGNDGLVLPEFGTHNGASAKRRAQEADRKRADRGAQKPGPDDGGKPSASDADKNGTREEKRRGSTSPDGEGGEPPTDRDLIFFNGVPLLTAAGVAEKNARSMLAGLAKTHGDAAVVQALSDCAASNPVQPVSWLQAALRSKPAGRQAQTTKHSGAAAAIFEGANHV